MSGLGSEVSNTMRHLVSVSSEEILIPIAIDLAYQITIGTFKQESIGRLMRMHIEIEMEQHLPVFLQSTSINQNSRNRRTSPNLSMIL